MLGKTHLAIGVLGALLLLPFIDVPNAFVFIVIVAIGALLPDIDHEKSTINKVCPVTRILRESLKENQAWPRKSNSFASVAKPTWI